jgi:hypothetical protein
MAVVVFLRCKAAEILLGKESKGFSVGGTRGKQSQAQVYGFFMLYSDREGGRS